MNLREGLEVSVRKVGADWEVAALCRGEASTARSHSLTCADCLNTGHLLPLLPLVLHAVKAAPHLRAAVT